MNSNEEKQIKICQICEREPYNENNIRLEFDCNHVMCLFCFKKIYNLTEKNHGKFNCFNCKQYLIKDSYFCEICSNNTSGEKRRIGCVNSFLYYNEKVPNKIEEISRKCLKIKPIKQQNYLSEKKVLEKEKSGQETNSSERNWEEKQLKFEEERPGNLFLECSSQTNTREEVKNNTSSENVSKKPFNKLENRDNTQQSGIGKILTNVSNEKKCLICDERKESQNFLILECSHDFCSNCIKKDWQTKIRSKKINEKSLFCPQCKQNISYDFLKTNLEKQLFSEYDELLAQACIFESAQKVYCPRKECSSLNLADKRLSYVQCEKCKFKFCLECNTEWELHKGIPCKEFQTRNEEDPIEKLIRENKWRKCPECGIVIEKTKFCNFIKCQSSICQKRTTFCYLCGEILKGNPNDHYLDGNTYAKCNTRGR